MFTILIVDDDPSVLDMLYLLISRLGTYKLYKADWPGGAIQIAKEISGRSDSIDLLITDMGMPIMTGRVLNRYLLEKFPKMKVIYISGSEKDDVFGDEEVNFVCKLNLDQLALKVREVLEEK